MNYIILKTEKLNELDAPMLYASIRSRHQSRKSIIDKYIKIYRHKIIRDGEILSLGDIRLYLKIKESDYVMELLCGKEPLDIDNEKYIQINEEYGVGIKIYLEFID